MRSFALTLCLLPILALGALTAHAAPHGPSLQGPEPEEARAEIEALIQEHAAIWNRGDLEAFAAFYAEDTVFLSPSGVHRGRDQVLARYRERYPDKAAMGTLALEILDLRFAYGDVQPDGFRAVTGVSVAGRWRLSYAEGDREDASGLTLIVLRPGPQGGWVIVQDASM